MDFYNEPMIDFEAVTRGFDRVFKDVKDSQAQNRSKPLYTTPKEQQRLFYERQKAVKSATL